MSYTMIKNKIISKKYPENGLENLVLSFIRNRCQGLRFDKNKAVTFDSENPDSDGTSLKKNQIPYNMEKDIDRLCLENAVERFLKSGKKEDAFDVYFCYLEMFVGGYEKTRRMIELLSEFEANGSELLMRHRDHYSHSVYVFLIGLAVYESNDIYRNTYNKYYGLTDEHESAHHYLQYWGLASLFHDIGYPFELPFEQVESYFEVNGDNRENKPFVAYHALNSLISINEKVKEDINNMLGADYENTNQLFARLITDKLGNIYGFSEKQMLECLTEKPACPDKFNYYMDHAYFSASVLFKKLFEEMNCELKAEHLDSLTAILMHNSLYKFSIADYKGKNNKPFKAELHPLAYMLMLCDELQCWDRTSYGRKSKKELHPMDCTFDFSDNKIKAVYLYDEKEMSKVNIFKDSYISWLQNPEGKKAPALKSYSEMYIKNNGISKFQKDIQKIVDLTDIKLSVDIGLVANVRRNGTGYLSDSNFINLYNFAVVLNGRWNNSGWKDAKISGQEDKFLTDEKVLEEFSDSFKQLSLEYKLSNINQAKAFAKYLNEIGCFYTDKSVDFEMVEKFSKEELVKIGLLEHQRWLQEHYNMGWIYGNPNKNQRDLMRQHKDMIPDFDGTQEEVSETLTKINYERLDKAEQDKDTDPMECMLAMLRMFDGIRIYRLH